MSPEGSYEAATVRSNGNVLSASTQSEALSKIMQPPDHLEHLLFVLGERDIPLSRDDVQWAFDAPNTKETVVEWVKEYLGADTLLSKDELELYGKLKRNGTVRAIQAGEDLTTVRPFVESDIRSALDTLKASTSAIEKQTQSLRSQQQALLSYEKGLDDGESRRKQASEQRRKKYALEKQHVQMAADELLEGLTGQLAASQQQLQSANGTLTASVTETLKGDDRILDRLQGLAGQLHEDDGPSRDAIAERTKMLSVKLETFLAEQIRCRLDRTFLECGLETSESSVHVHNPDREDSPERFVEEDLNSLYSEIQAVAHMSVQQSFVVPIMAQLEQKQHLNQAHSDNVLDHITSTLAYLTTRIHEVSTRVQDHHSHRIALKAISDALSSESLKSKLGCAPSPSKQQTTARPVLPHPPSASPTRAVGAGDGKSPVVTDASSQSLQQLLGLWGISMLEHDKGLSINESVSAAMAERAGLLTDQEKTLDSTVRDLLSTTLSESSSSLQLIRDALYEDSHYGRFRLADQGLSRNLEMLESDIDEVKQGMANLDFEALHVPEGKRDRFIEQWNK